MLMAPTEQISHLEWLKSLTPVFEQRWKDLPYVYRHGLMAGHLEEIEKLSNGTQD